MICGLLKPTEGDIKINGRLLNNSSLSDLRSLIGICPQNNIIWQKLTCLEQLEFMGEMYGLKRMKAREKSEFLLEMMGLKDKSKKLAQTLSGGMKRRLNICLALVHDPEIAIFDEPEAGLDPQSRILVRDFIRTIAKDKTIILTTHNMDEADRLSDRVAIIDKGELLLVDSPENLKKTIGEGDILEIVLISDDENNIQLANIELQKICESIRHDGNYFILKAKNLIEKIPDITIILKNLKTKIGEMKIRENSLEDVFIHLTGRSLRQ